MDSSGLKFKILVDFLSIGCSVLLSDVDVIWLYDPFPMLYKDTDVEGMTDGWDEPTSYGCAHANHPKTSQTPNQPNMPTPSAQDRQTMSPLVTTLCDPQTTMAARRTASSRATRACSTCRRRMSRMR